MKKKTYQLGVRMDEDLLARLRNFEERTGISSSALARATLESALDYFEAKNEIAFPLRCVPAGFIPPPHFRLGFCGNAEKIGEKLGVFVGVFRFGSTFQVEEIAVRDDLNIVASENFFYR